MKVAIYHSNILKKGGIETFLFVFAKRMSKYLDITLFYDKADNDSLFEIAKYIDTEKYTGQTIKSDVLILASAWGTSPTKTTISPRIVQMVHADYKAYANSGTFHFKPDSRVTEYIAVSKQAQKSLKELHNIDSTVIYNLIDTDTPIYKKEPLKTIRIVTACRLSQEKGIERCIKLSKILPFPHVWDIYGETPNTAYASKVKQMARGSKVRFHPFTDNPQKEMANATWVAQLSDTEGFCYTIQEALYQKTPVLVTPFPSMKEVNCKNFGYIIDFELKNINFDIILNPPIPERYKGNSNEQDWLNFLKQ